MFPMFINSVAINPLLMVIPYVSKCYKQCFSKQPCTLKKGKNGAVSSLLEIMRQETNRIEYIGLLMCI